MVHLRVNFLCCISYGTGQTFKDVYSSLQYHPGFFPCPEYPLAPLFHPSPHPNSGDHCSFHCLHNVAFLRMWWSWNHILYGLFKLGSFTLLIYVPVPSMSSHGFIAPFFLVLNHIPLSGCISLTIPPCVCSVSSDSSVTLWTAAHQAPLSLGFIRQEYCSDLSFPSPGDLPDSGIKPESPALAGRFFTAQPPGGAAAIHLLKDISVAPNFLLLGIQLL